MGVFWLVDKNLFEKLIWKPWTTPRIHEEIGVCIIGISSKSELHYSTLCSQVNHHRI